MFVIWAPPFTQKSAGVRCLYQLCRELNVRGQRAFMTGPEPQPAFPWVDKKAAVRLARAGVAIYPEVVKGNPYRARRVIRWVLNKPGLLGNGDKIYEAREKVFIYSDFYRAYVQNRIAGKLFMPVVDRHLFYPGQEEKSLECFYVGKCKSSQLDLIPHGLTEITRTTPERSELGPLLRRSRVLYTYDNSTLLVYEALLCGCAVVIIPDGTMEREDWQRHELGTTGIGWGMDEREQAIAEVDPLMVIQRHEATVRDFGKQVERLIGSV